jgi:uncharacterized protein YdeI (YjbR/CyaY-like superfamily)
LLESLGMGKRDPRVDAYIAKSADFAKPILAHLRETVHAACPEVEETIKWSNPAFIYKGMLCGMAAFKQHATFGFWKNSLVFGDGAKSTNPMEQFGRLTNVSDLPPAAKLTAYVRKAARLNDEGVKVARKPKAAPKPIRVPSDLAAALKKDKKAAAAFDAFSPSHKREYIEWITDAKSVDTRARRLAQAVEWIGAGKSRNWKYERK